MSKSTHTDAYHTSRYIHCDDILLKDCIHWLISCSLQAKFALSSSKLVESDSEYVYLRNDTAVLVQKFQKELILTSGGVTGVHWLSWYWHTRKCQAHHCCCNVFCCCYCCCCSWITQWNLWLLIKESTVLRGPTICGENIQTSFAFKVTLLVLLFTASFSLCTLPKSPQL